MTGEATQKAMVEKMKDVPCPCGIVVPSLLMPGSSACHICFQYFCSVECWRRYGRVQHAHGRKIKPEWREYAKAPKQETARVHRKAVATAAATHRRRVTQR